MTESENVPEDRSDEPNEGAWNDDAVEGQLIGAEEDPVGEEEAEEDPAGEDPAGGE